MEWNSFVLGMVAGALLGVTAAAVAIAVYVSGGGDGP